MMTVDVIVPACDEEQTVARVVHCLVKAREEGVIRRILVVDDGSGDHTAKRSQEAGAEVLRLRTNRGKAEAFAAGVFRLAKSPPNLVMTLDADLVPFTPSQLRMMVDLFHGDSQLKMVVSAFEGNSAYTHLSGQRVLRWDALSPLLRKNKKWVQYFGIGPSKREKKGGGYSLESALNILVGNSSDTLRKPSSSFKIVETSLHDTPRPRGIEAALERNTQMHRAMMISADRQNRAKELRVGRSTRVRRPRAR